MMKKTICIFSFVALLLLNAGETLACSCGRFPTPAQAFAKADAVFSGMVSEARKGKWQIAVERVWKGEVEEEISLRDLSVGTSCAANFELGKRYIVFASIDASQRKTTYNPNGCSWTIRFKTWGSQDEDQRVRLMNDHDRAKTVYWMEDWLIQNLKELGEEKAPIKSKGERKR